VTISTPKNEAETASAVQQVLTQFVSKLVSAVGPRTAACVLAGDRTLKSDDLGSQPESWTEDALVRPLIEAVGLTKGPGRPTKRRDAGGKTRRETPDFRLSERGGELVVIGEVKSPNRIADAEQELLDDYLSNKAWPDYGIATDGIEWVLYRAEHGGDFLEFDEVERVDLRPTLRRLYEDHEGIEGARTDGGETGSSPVEQFTSVFEPEPLERLLTQTAPREFRDARDASIEEFYDLYVELLFGEGEKHDYETNVREDIITEHDPSDHERDLFAVTLLNRLLFVKFLETRGVLPEGHLRSQLHKYEGRSDDLPVTFYDAYLKTLFYKQLGTPPEDRQPQIRNSGPDLPYLNGGLFRETVPHEQKYDVANSAIQPLIKELAAGGRFDPDGDGFDPAILGSVFEKTINHIGGESGHQRELGAYYTPNDVTRHVSAQTIDAKVHDLVAETFAEHTAPGADPDAVREEILDTDLATVLRHVEEGPGTYGEARAALEALLEKLSELTVLDPACGSGHFLTTAMEELHQVQVSVMRGLNAGRDPTPEERYRAKRELALNVIYGVDVDEVAVEIAKLRVWLKMLEDNGWEESYGRLPNIDVNVVAGNSLVGFPTRGSVQTQVGAVDDRLSDLRYMRKAYKWYDAGSLGAIQRLEREISRDRDEKYLRSLNYTVATRIPDRETFDALLATVPDGEFYPTIQSVKARRTDEGGDGDGDGNGSGSRSGSGNGNEGGDALALTDEDKELLADAGFQWQEWRETNKSATLDVAALLTEADATRSRLEIQQDVIESLREVLDAGFVFSEVERQPTGYDLEEITGTPLHWDIEFPELLSTETNSVHPEVSVDIVVGNPPYGNILGESEATFTAPFDTHGINDVSAQFVERQLQLLDEDGYFGNVTTLRLIYQSSLEEFHDLLQENLDPARVACFGFRPSRVFENAHVRVAIITGGKSTDSDGEIRTSDLVLFDEENRQQRFREIEYGPTAGLVLRDRIGGDDTRSGPILPKVGGEQKRAILETLREQSDTVFRDRYTRTAPDGDDPRHPVWRREGVLYWINPMLEELYDAREVQPLYFETELAQKTAFLVLSSSLYYVYWQTYGNQHHHNWTQLSTFPWPDEKRISQYDAEICELADTLWKRMKETFKRSRAGRGDFFTSSLRPIVDDVDELVGRLYELSDEQISYTQAYLTDLGEGSGRAGTEETDLTYEPLFGEK
jgi:hypothetical protein